MSRSDLIGIMVAVTVFIVLGILMAIIVHYRRLKREALIQEPTVSPEVRAASHNLANEATKLKAVTRRISESSDPVAALVSAMTGRRYERR